MAKKESIPSPEKQTRKRSDAEQVAVFMHQFEHPLKAEIEAVRQIIKNSNSKLSERIKWNAPSYFTGVDLLTFHLRPVDKVHLVFHHEAIIKVQSALLEGIYKYRRMMYFKSRAEIDANRPKLERILNEYILLTEAAVEQ